MSGKCYMLKLHFCFQCVPGSSRTWEELTEEFVKYLRERERKVEMRRKKKDDYFSSIFLASVGIIFM